MVSGGGGTAACGGGGARGLNDGGVGESMVVGVEGDLFLTNSTKMEKKGKTMASFIELCVLSVCVVSSS